MIPHKTPFFLPLFYPSLTWKIPSVDKALYLTFDDGPVPGPTEFVLEKLAAASAKATFFCIGDNVKKHPEIFRKVVESGHAVGNHTYNHLNGWTTATGRYVENVHRFNETLAAAGYPATRLFRPPYGRIKCSQIRALRDHTIVMWDVLTFDYNSRRSGELSLRKSINATRPGSIIVFHDSFKAEKNLVYILPRFIDHFAGKGFTFNIIAR